MPPMPEETATELWDALVAKAHDHSGVYRGEEERVALELTPKLLAALEATGHSADRGAHPKAFGCPGCKALADARAALQEAERG